MTLHEFTRLHGLRAVAEMMNVNISTVHRWAVGKITIPAERAVQLEKVSSGAVMRHEARPDLYEVST